jgi:hypothetical protein
MNGKQCSSVQYISTVYQYISISVYQYISISYVSGKVLKVDDDYERRYHLFHAQNQSDHNNYHPPGTHRRTMIKRSTGATTAHVCLSFRHPLVEGVDFSFMTNERTTALQKSKRHNCLRQNILHSHGCTFAVCQCQFLKKIIHHGTKIARCQA